jgi:putative SOS response-associated peptidase YedK
MCGRFTLNAPPQDVARLFDLDAVPSLAPRFNIAPTQLVVAVRIDGQSGKRAAAQLRWGLVPFWAESPAGGARMINARSETAATRPAFRAAFRKRRCLLPATGFYEWQRRDGRKQPFHICRRDHAPFAFAGLWEHWAKAGQEPVESCTVLTTQANDLVRPLHDRMPVIIAPEDFARWLDPDQSVESLEPLFRPIAAEEWTAYSVSTLVNSPKNEAPRLIEPVETGRLFD